MADTTPRRRPLRDLIDRTLEIDHGTNLADELRSEWDGGGTTYSAFTRVSEMSGIVFSRRAFYKWADEVEK